MIRAILDDRLGVRIAGERRLVYTEPAAADADRPPHVRAASAMAVWRDQLAIVQDDTSFIAIVDGDRVDSIALPRGPGGRRRFERALGNKLDKLDLEACIVVGDDLLALGSGSIAGTRDRIARVRGTGAVELVDASPLYASVRAAVGGDINVEGAVIAGAELWLFHRGNTGPSDPGPAVVRFALADVLALLDGGAPPIASGIDRYDLGEHAGVRFGFTDATLHAERVFVLLATEASPDAIADGAVGGSRIGVLDRGAVRCAELVDRDGRPCKAEAIVFDRGSIRLAVDCDDVDVPALLYTVELDGSW